MPLGCGAQGGAEYSVVVAYRRQTGFYLDQPILRMALLGARAQLPEQLLHVGVPGQADSLDGLDHSLGGTLCEKGKERGPDTSSLPFVSNLTATSGPVLSGPKRL